MKLNRALVLAVLVGISPALAFAQRPTPMVHQHGSSFHDRSPRIHVHESQPHH